MNNASPYTPQESGLYICECIRGLRMHSSKLDSILKAGADLTVTDDEGMTSLHHAVTQGCMTFIAALIKGGSDPAQRVVENGMDIMMLAVINRQHEALTHLVKNGYPLTYQDHNGMTVMDHAIDIDDIRSIKILLDKQPSLFVARNDKGQTPLENAYRLGRVKSKLYLEQYAALICTELPPTAQKTAVRKMVPRGFAK